MSDCVVLPCVVPTPAFWEHIRALKEQGFSHIIAVELPAPAGLPGGVFAQDIRPDIEGYHALCAEARDGTGVALRKALAWYAQNLPALGTRGVVIDARADCPPCVAAALAHDSTLFPDALVALRRAKGGRFSGLVMRVLCGVSVPRADWYTLALPNALVPVAKNVTGNDNDFLVNMAVLLAKSGVPVRPGGYSAAPREQTGPFSARRPFGGLAHAKALVQGLAAFIINAALSGVVSVIVYALLVKLALLGLPDGPRLFLSEFGARTTSSVINYTLNRRLFFTGQGQVFSTAVKYYALLVTQSMLSFLGVWGLHALGFDEVIAKICIDAVLGFFSYQAQMRWVFRQRETVAIKPQREARLP